MKHKQPEHYRNITSSKQLYMFNIITPIECNEPVRYPTNLWGTKHKLSCYVF